MKILGLNAYHADASAALFIDGELAFAIEEERLNRKKHCAGFPAVTRAASPSLFWATMAGHAVLALLGLAVLVMGARMLMARFAGVDVPPDPESERDRQRRLDRMREEK